MKRRYARQIKKVEKKGKVICLTGFDIKEIYGIQLNDDKGLFSVTEKINKD